MQEVPKELLPENVNVVDHYPRLWGWLCRGMWGLVQWCEQYVDAHMWGCPTDQFRAAADRINKFCDEADAEKIAGGYHIDYSKNRRTNLKTQIGEDQPEIT